MFKKIVLIPIVLISLFIQAQTKIVVVPPSKDTTVVTFTANATATNTISSSVTVKPTKVPPVNPPPDTVIVTPPATGYNLIYSNDFSTNADIDPDNQGQKGAGGLSTSVYLSAPGSFHSVPSDVSSGIRSEVSLLSKRMTTEGAMEWDVMYIKIPANNAHSFQFHPNTSGGSASPGLWHVNGKFQWNNWIGGINQTHPTGITIVANHWYHMRIEYSFGKSGYFKHWIDGNLAVSWTGQVGDNSGQYPKCGVNMWSQAASSFEGYYDNWRIYSKQ